MAFINSNKNDGAQTNLQQLLTPRLRQANTVAFLGQALSQAGNAIMAETSNNLKSLAAILGDIRDGHISREGLSQAIVDINSNLDQGLGNSFLTGSQVTNFGNMNMPPSNLQMSNNSIPVAAVATTNPVVQQNLANNHTKTTKFTTLKLYCIQQGCVEAFESMDQLEHHLNAKHKFAPFRCFQLECDKSFGTRKQLEYHRRREHKHMKVWICKQCKRPFTNSVRSPDRFKGLCEHFIKNHYLGVFKCANCERTFDCQAKAIKHYDQSVCLMFKKSQTNRLIATDPTVAEPYSFAPQSPIHINILPRMYQQINNNQQVDNKFCAKMRPKCDTNNNV